MLGGFSTKVHLLSCGKDSPLQVRLTARQAGEAGQFSKLLQLKKQKPMVLVADKGHESQVIRKALREHLIRAQISERCLSKGSRRRRKGRSPVVDKVLYSQRSIIERLFGRLKEMRHFACRFDKLAGTYMAFIQLAFMRIYLKPYFSDTP
ncbi:MAG TPA: transposase [Pontibacter sp.]